LIARDVVLEISHSGQSSYEPAVNAPNPRRKHHKRFLPYRSPNKYNEQILEKHRSLNNIMALRIREEIKPALICGLKEHQFEKNT
jgi:hypothetical protein